MNTCVTCRWVVKKGVLRCSHPVIGLRAASVDPVSGLVEKAQLNFCGTNRLHIGPCGHDGRLWEPNTSDIPEATEGWFQRATRRIKKG